MGSSFNEVGNGRFAKVSYLFANGKRKIVMILLFLLLGGFEAAHARNELHDINGLGEGEMESPPATEGVSRAEVDSKAAAAVKSFQDDVIAHDEMVSDLRAMKNSTDRSPQYLARRKQLEEKITAQKHLLDFKLTELPSSPQRKVVIHCRVDLQHVSAGGFTFADSSKYFVFEAETYSPEEFAKIRKELRRFEGFGHSDNPHYPYESLAPFTDVEYRFAHLESLVRQSCDHAQAALRRKSIKFRQEVRRGFFVPEVCDCKLPEQIHPASATRPQ